MSFSLAACRKKKNAQGDDATDVEGGFGPVLVVSGSQPAKGDATIVASGTGGGITIVAGPQTPAPSTPAPSPSPSAPVDRPPTWLTSIGNVPTAEDAAFTRTADASDLDADPITYAFVPAEMTCDDCGWTPAPAINALTGQITGTPTNSAVGSCTMKVKATAGGKAITQVFTVTVTNSDDLPSWSPTVTAFTVDEDTALHETVHAVDVDVGETPTYALDPAVMTCDDGTWSPALAIDAATGELSGTPRNGDVGTCTLVVTASSAGHSIAETITITVNQANDLPTWTTPLADFVIARETSAAGNYALASDVDAGSALVYSLDTANMTCDDGAWNPNVSINAATDELSGTPRLADVGTCTLRIVATSGSDSISDDVNVTVTNSSTPPSWGSTITTKSVNEDAALTGATASATDFDLDPVTYSLDLANMTCDNGAWSPQIAVDGTTGVVTGTPTNSDVGSCTVRVRASAGGDNIYQTFTVNVANTNDLPTWSSTIGNFNLAEDAALAKTAVAQDVDAGAVITYSLDSSNMTCDDGAWSPNVAINSATGVLTGTPTNADVGTCTIRVIAASGADSLYQTSTVTVLNTNDLPTWNGSIGNLIMVQGAPISATASASDIDSGSTIVYSLDTPNMTCDNGTWSPQISINASTGVLAGRPSEEDVGSCTVR